MDPVFPKYAHTFTVIRPLFDQNGLEVEYTPVDTRLTKYTCVVPLMPHFSRDNLTEYLAEYAPNHVWFTQEVILDHGNTLVGATA